MSSHKSNNLIISIFEQLRDIRISQNKEWEAKAYEKAISAIRTHHHEITSGKMAKQLPNIGDRMAGRIDEILTTGALAELGPQSESYDEKSQVLKLFESIHRVGPKTAQKWYQLGYRKIEDIPLTDCTDAQKIGIQLHADLNQRIPRAEVDEINKVITDFLASKGIKFQICGSYRRGRPDCGDVDILVISQPDRDVLAEVLECPIFTHTLAKGSKKYLGIGKIKELHRRIDVEVVQPEEYPYAVVYFTGPGSFNVKMRDHTSQMGYRLNEKSLTDYQGNSYSAKSEEHVFELLGLKYLTPKERDAY